VLEWIHAMEIEARSPSSSVAALIESTPALRTYSKTTNTHI
jgi:hypothetical protein